MLSASGVLLDARAGVILTTATLIGPFLKEIGRKECGCFSLIQGAKIKVLLEGDVTDRDRTKGHQIKPSADLRWHKVRLLDIIKCAPTTRSIIQLLGRWEIGWSKRPKEDSAEYGNHIPIQRHF